MISIPIWLFIVLIVTNLFADLALAVVIYGTVAIIGLIGDKRKMKNYCPDKLEPADQNDNPEYIPK